MKRKTVTVGKTGKSRSRRWALISLAVLGGIAFFALVPPPGGSRQPALPTLAVIPSLIPTTDLTAIAVLPIVTASATITETPTATPITPTSSPSATNAPAETWYTTGTANLRSCASTTCDLVVQLSSGAAINMIGYEYGETYKGSAIWRIVDYGGHTVYVHSSLVSADPPRPTSASVQIIPPTSAPVVVQPPAAPALACPRNCDEAVALGWTAQQAGQCPRLDRDKDGVACYGD